MSKKIKPFTQKEIDKVLSFLLKEREKQGKTGVELSVYLNSYKSDVYRIESGEYQLTLGVFLEYCRFLHLKPDEVLQKAL